MARGDGKARKGLTKGNPSGVKRMATGGFASSSREGGFAAAGPSRLESPGQRASVSPGAGNISAGRIAGGGGRSDPRNPQSNTARVDYLTNPARASARLGPNAAQAMADAGVNPDTATFAARSINRLAGGVPNILGDPNPGQRLATIGPDGITYSEVPTSIKTKQFYDRILPEEELPVRATLPTRPISYTPAPRPAAPAQSPMAVYGNEFSFTPEQTTDALKSMYRARLPGASYSELMSLQKAMKQPENKSMAATLAAPFSSRTRAPMAPADAPARLPTRPVSTLAGYTGQEQRFPTAPAVKQFTDQIAPGGTKQFYDRILPESETPTAPAGRPTPPSVVAGRNFSAGAFPYRDRGGEGGGRRRRKKPIIEETETMKSGGRVRSTDGVVSRGKTRGRYI